MACSGIDCAFHANLLRNKGLKVTPSRMAVVHVMSESDVPLDAERVYTILLSGNDKPNLSTVYRTLEQFVEKGLLRKTPLAPGESRTLFEWEDGNHLHHFRCTACNKTWPLPNCPVHLLEAQLVDSMQVQITGHRLELFGLCKVCMTQK